MAAKKSFAEKLITKTSNKTSDKLAEKISTGIVKAVTTKPKKKTSTKASTTEEKKPATKRSSKSSTTTGESKAVSAAQGQESAADMQARMAMRYNTKRCPECGALCFNAPVECPYCSANLKSVKPLTPQEFDELSKQ